MINYIVEIEDSFCGLLTRIQIMNVYISAMKEYFLEVKNESKCPIQRGEFNGTFHHSNHRKIHYLFHTIPK
jgi:hypothetical protein